MSDTLISGDQSAASAPRLDIAGMRAAGIALLNGTPPAPASPAPAPAAPPAPAPALSDLSVADLAVRSMNKPGVLPAVPASPAPAAAAPAPAPTAPVTPDTPAADVLDIPDDKYVRVVINGQPQVLLGKEAKRQMISGASYTQGMQQLRQTEKMLKESLGVDPTPETIGHVRDALVAAGKMQTLLTDPQMLRTYFQQTFKEQLTASAPAAPTPGAPDNTPLVSAREVEALVAQRLRDAEAQQLATVQSAVEQGISAVEIERRKGELRVQMDTTISQVIAENPVLTAIPDLRRTVQREVKAMGPRTEAELLHATQTVLSGLLENVRPFMAAPGAQQRAILQNTGVEPPQGTPVAIPKVSLIGADGKFQWAGLRTAAKTHAGMAR